MSKFGLEILPHRCSKSLAVKNANLKGLNVNSFYKFAPILTGRPSRGLGCISHDFLRQATPSGFEIGFGENLSLKK
jgi:hypothetical protein